MQVKIKTLDQLLKVQGKKIKDMPAILVRNYYNTIRKHHEPSQKTIDGLCEFFEISEKQLRKFIK